MASGAENGQGEAGLAGGDHRAALPLARDASLTGSTRDGADPENELPPMVAAPEREAALSLVRFTPYTKEPSTGAFHQGGASPMVTAGAENGQALPLARRVGEQPTAHVKRHYVKLFVTRDTASTLGFS
jgi:hypothetical protein